MGKMIKKIVFALLLIGMIWPGPSMGYRDYYADVILDTSGNPQPSAKVSVFLAGTSTPVAIYSSLIDTTPSYSVITRQDGTFSFYLDRLDYGTTQKFDFSVTKPGFMTMTKPNIDTSNPVLGTYPIST